MRVLQGKMRTKQDPNSARKTLYHGVHVCHLELVMESSGPQKAGSRPALPCRLYGGAAAPPLSQRCSMPGASPADIPLF